jgi:hypothetical protein
MAKILNDADVKTSKLVKREREKERDTQSEREKEFK